MIVKASRKVFNPLLGETYELVLPKQRLISETISHHPIIVGINVQGYSGYELHFLMRPDKPKIRGGCVKLQEYYK